MNYGLRVLPPADSDVDEAAAFIARDGIERALRFYDAVNATYNTLRESPKRWPLYELTNPELCDVRKCAVKGFDQFLVFYRIDADTVEIIRVIHGARDIPALIDKPE